MRNPFWFFRLALILLIASFISCDNTSLEDLQPQSIEEQNQGPTPTTNALAMRAAVNLDTTIQDSVIDKDGDGDIDMELDECFEFVFPIEITLPGQGTEIANDDKELDDLLEDWFTGNPNSVLFPRLIFPLQVTRSGDSLLTIESEAALDTIFKDCYEMDELEYDEEDWGYKDDDDEEDRDDDDKDDDEDDDDEEDRDDDDNEDDDNEEDEDDDNEDDDDDDDEEEDEDDDEDDN